MNLTCKCDFIDIELHLIAMKYKVKMINFNAVDKFGIDVIYEYIYISDKEYQFGRQNDVITNYAYEPEYCCVKY